MKPKNRIMCPDCMRPKILFESERKANAFIKWNGGEMRHGEQLRAYYCPACCGWHISHQEYRTDYDDSTKNLVDAYNRSVKMQGKRRIDRLIYNEDYEAAARCVFDDMPENIKNAPTKGIIRKYLKSYFAENAMKDDGGLRHAIYTIWLNKRN